MAYQQLPKPFVLLVLLVPFVPLVPFVTFDPLLDSLFGPIFDPLFNSLLDPLFGSLIGLLLVKLLLLPVALVQLLMLPVVLSQLFAVLSFEAFPSVELPELLFELLTVDPLLASPDELAVGVGAGVGGHVRLWYDTLWRSVMFSV